MKVVITGGLGFLGQTLAQALLTSHRKLRSNSSTETVTSIILADISENEYLIDLPSLAKEAGVDLKVILGDVSNVDYCNSIIGRDDNNEGLSIFHLGAVMSGAPPDLALKVNLHGTINMLEAARAWSESSPNHTRPTFLFSSAGATLGAGHEADWVSKTDVISDATRAAPHTTYGTTKACCELLLADYSRRGFIDGRGVRLPTVIVRAGAPNAAVTGCFSSVIREPLAGKEAVLPVGPDVLHGVTSFRSAIMGMLAVHDASVDSVDRLLGFDRTVFLPTRAVSLRQLEEALRRVVSKESLNCLGKITYDEDTALSAILESFPTRVDAKRAVSLGAPAVPEIDEMIREYCTDFGAAVADGVLLNSKQVEKASTEVTEHIERVVALITGAGSGIGRAVAIRLSCGGWGGPTGRGTHDDGKALRVSLVLAGRRSAPLEETKTLCEKTATDLGVDIDVLVVPTDVTKESEVQDLMHAIRSNFHRLDLLFNNAGINMAPTSVEKIDTTDFTRIIDTNLTACWRVAKESMKLMSTQQPQGGRIINNGSISAFSPRPGSAPYTASKHAVLGLTKSIALDGRSMNVTCGQIDFGNVLSDLTKNMSVGMPQANGTMMPEPTFSVVDAANTVHAMAALPLEANVLNMTVMASGMPFVGRG
ncbi:hypothetical protein HJC23_009524 [Cyclotella cryptica]|uniref:NAD-dependent epimerase/dehydratase domain-containing protein n=1 Tax=Cyclotella cryptica TaxID=29204 RepID=A0ABD3Q703_9STRA|eukprot:CCRYP_008853-RA/>CCRYP_008853-RA protein AED:0.37 eAED:0.37 QI:0/-1/0/1/-1/1/1/0/649